MSGDDAALLERAIALLGRGGAQDVAAAEAVLLSLLGRLPAARPWAARAYDLRRRLAGQPQKFGTVAERRADGSHGLWPVDPATTDSERSKWGLPGLAELRRRAELEPWP